VTFISLFFFFFWVQDNQELFISLIMAYIFNTMTHLAIDVRLMAFKFLDLVVENHPLSFFLYAEKVS
jgi:pre-rRNA-processing protein IPI1